MTGVDENITEKQKQPIARHWRRAGGCRARCNRVKARKYANFRMTKASGTVGIIGYLSSVLIAGQIFTMSKKLGCSEECSVYCEEEGL